MGRLRFLHPVLFLIGSILLLYSHTSIFVSPDQVVRPLLLLVAVLVLLARPAFWLAGDWDGAFILLSLFVLGVCAYPPFFYAAVAVSAVSVVLWLILCRIHQRRVRLVEVNGVLSFVGFLLVIILTVLLGRQLISLPGRGAPSSSSQANLRSAKGTPDIYYIVLDGYARADVLADLYGFDNSDFVQFLLSRGFVVPARSRANYSITALSVASTLNMDYIDAFAPGLKGYPYWWLMSPYIDHSRVRTFLEQRGYRSVALGTNWGITDNPTADVYLSRKALVLTDFEFGLLTVTPLRFISPLLSHIASVPSFGAHRESIRFSFNTLRAVPGLAGPKFVFTHIIAPHAPFVLSADGKPIEPGYRFGLGDGNECPLSDEQYGEGYVGQLQFVNSQLETVIDAILRESTTPPVILLQADHGPGMLTDFRSSGNTCLRERFSVFAAYLLPGVGPSAVPADMTPVNLFRMLFNHYFSADLPSLPNIHLFSSSGYVFRPDDVTSRVDTCTANERK